MAFVTYPHPVLAQKGEATKVDATLLAIGERLRAAAIDARAYGLAGAHIGEAAPVIVLNVAPDAPKADYRLFFNPRVSAVADEVESGTEGSVSLPGVEVSVERPVWAEIAYEDADGAGRAERFEGFLARCALHEIDQVDGVFFLDRLSRLKRDMVLKKFLKRQRLG